MDYKNNKKQFVTILYYYIIFKDPNEIIDDLKIDSKSFFKDIKTLINLNEKPITKFFYFIKSIIHKVLYDLEEIICINYKDYNLSSLFYLGLLIMDNIDIINYSFSIEYIKEINNLRKKINNIYELIIISKIIINLINNYKGLDEYNEKDEGELTELINDNTNFIKKNLKSLEDIGLNYKEKDIINNKIDKIYINIINTLIKQRKFEDYEYASNIMNQLGLKEIHLTKTMCDELLKLLNSNEKYITDYMISNIDDLYNEKKINFYHILFKYILKNSRYIYQIPSLLKTGKIIRSIIKNKEENIKFYNINKDTREKLEDIIIIITGSEYYFNEYLNHFKLDNLKNLLNINKNILYESYEDIKNLTEIKENNNNNNNNQHYDYFLKDYFNNENNKNLLLKVFTEKEYNHIKNYENKGMYLSTNDNALKKESNKYKILDFSRIIGTNEKKVSYIKQLSNGFFIAGGVKDLIFYDKTFQIIHNTKIKNNNIYEIEIKNNIIKTIILYYNKISKSALNLNEIKYKNTLNVHEIILNFGGWILFGNKKDTIFLICNSNGLYPLSNMFFTNCEAQSKQFSPIINNNNILSSSFYGGIKINKNIIALTSNKIISKGKDELIFYHL